MKRPLGVEKLELIANSVCRGFGYLCFDEHSARDALPLIASELAILETYNFLSRVGEKQRHGYELVLECMDDDKCLETLINTVNSVVDIYMHGEDYFLSIDEEGLKRAIRIAEDVASAIEKKIRGRRGSTSAGHSVAEKNS